MNTQSPYSKRALFFIVAAALISAVLCALGLSWYYERTHRWIRLVSPTGETVTEIVALNRSLMPYVRTDQGNLYFCSGSTWRDTCVPLAPTQLPISEVHPKWLTCPPPFPQTPPEPGTVVDAVELGHCAEARTYSKVILLSDGSLWQWRRTYSWVEHFAVVTIAVLGLMIGIAGGLLIVKTRQMLRAPLPPGTSRE